MKKKLIVFLMAAVFLLSSVTPAFATSVNDGWSGVMPVIQQNCNSGAVRGAQWLYKDLSLYSDTIDSNFGPKTLAAVKAYQKKKGITQDGSVGPVTWGKMRTEIGNYDQGPVNWSYSVLYGKDRWLHRKSGGAWYVQDMTGAQTQYKMCS